jgi:hypothetical protein
MYNQETMRSEYYELIHFSNTTICNVFVNFKFINRTYYIDILIVIIHFNGI